MGAMKEFAGVYYRDVNKEWKTNFEREGGR